MQKIHKQGRVTLYIAEEILTELDKLRRKHDDLPSRSKLLMQMLEDGGLSEIIERLKTEKKSKIGEK